MAEMVKAAVVLRDRLLADGARGIVDLEPVLGEGRICEDPRGERAYVAPVPLPEHAEPPQLPSQRVVVPAAAATPEPPAAPEPGTRAQGDAEARRHRPEGDAAARGHPPAVVRAAPGAARARDGARRGAQPLAVRGHDARVALAPPRTLRRPRGVVHRRRRSRHAGVAAPAIPGVDEAQHGGLRECPGAARGHVRAPRSAGERRRARAFDGAGGEHAGPASGPAAPTRGPCPAPCFRSAGGATATLRDRAESPRARARRQQAPPVRRRGLTQPGARTMSTKPPKDPLIEAKIERALAKYRGVAPPHMIAAMRRQLEELLTTHPVAVGLLEQVRKLHPPANTDDVPKNGVEEKDEEKPS